MKARPRLSKLRLNLSLKASEAFYTEININICFINVPLGLCYELFSSNLHQRLTRILLSLQHPQIEAIFFSHTPLIHWYECDHSSSFLKMLSSESHVIRLYQAMLSLLQSSTDPRSLLLFRDFKSWFTVTFSNVIPMIS